MTNNFDADSTKNNHSLGNKRYSIIGSSIGAGYIGNTKPKHNSGDKTKLYELDKLYYYD